MITTFQLKGLKALGALVLIFSTVYANADGYVYKANKPASEHTLKPGEKWSTDEVVRFGMDNIRQAVSVSQGDIIQGKLNSQDYLAIADVVDRNVTDMVRKCKLSPDADKAFHIVVLVDLKGSVEFMRVSRNVQTQRVGALAVLQTLRNYGKYFQHNGWSFN
ncbi:hypothetical protein MCEKH45_01830 [Methylophilaceae bacterium]